MRLLLLASVAFLVSCTPLQPSGGSMAVEAFEERLDDAGAQLLDVRTVGEFSSGHLTNARNLDWTSGQLEAAVPDLDKSKPVLLYCASGRRSAAAAEFLRTLGFMDVADLEGGINAWVGAGMPTE